MQKQDVFKPVGIQTRSNGQFISPLHTQYAMIITQNLSCWLKIVNPK